MNNSEKLSKAQEKMKIKSNFARTCNRFSQFLKERRSLGDHNNNNTTTNIGFGTPIPSPRTEFSTQIQTKPDDHHITNEDVTINNVSDSVQDYKSLELFPLTSSITNSSDSTKKNMMKKANMTIIYEGKVLVFEDLEEEKAHEIMCLANEGVITTHFTHGNLLDLPIARRASLHRFMDKRKDRIAACAPYQLNNSISSKEVYKQDMEHHLELKL